MKIADEITKEEVAKMKFLCSHLRRPLEAIEEPVEFVNFLRRRGIISPGDVGYLIGLLDNSGNTRLADTIRDRGKKTDYNHCHHQYVHRKIMQT